MSKNSSFFWVILILAKLYSSNLEAKSLFQYIGVKANFPAVDFDVSQLEDETTAEVESQDTLGYISRDPEIIGLFAKVGHFSLELAHNISDDERTVDYKNLDLSWYHKRFSVRVMASQIEDFFLNQGEGNIDLDSLEEEEKNHEGFFFQNGAVDVSLGIVSWGLHLANTMDLAEYPKKTGGGLVGIVTGDWTFIDGPKPLIPTDLQNEFGSDGTILSTQMMSANFQLGLVQGIAIGPFYTGLSVAIGPGIAYVDYDLEDRVISREVEALKMSLALNLGVSTKSFFMGIEASQRTQEYLLESIVVAAVRTNIGASLGIRF